MDGYAERKAVMFAVFLKNTLRIIVERTMEMRQFMQMLGIRFGGSGPGADGRSREDPEGRTALSTVPTGFARAGFHQRAAGLIM